MSRRGFRITANARYARRTAHNRRKAHKDTYFISTDLILSAVFQIFLRFPPLASEIRLARKPSESIARRTADGQYPTNAGISPAFARVLILTYLQFAKPNPLPTWRRGRSAAGITSLPS